MKILLSLISLTFVYSLGVYVYENVTRKIVKKQLVRTHTVYKPGYEQEREQMRMDYSVRFYSVTGNSVKLRKLRQDMSDRYIGQINRLNNKYGKN